MGTDAVSTASLASLRLALRQLASLSDAGLFNENRTEKKKSNWSNVDVQARLTVKLV